MLNTTFINDIWIAFGGYIEMEILYILNWNCPTLEIHSLDLVPHSLHFQPCWKTFDILPMVGCVLCAHVYALNVSVEYKVSVGQSHRGQTALKI